MIKRVYFLFFLSGLAGLIYQIVWSRQFVLVFGSTTNSLVATMSAFMCGLALGSFIIGRKIDLLPVSKLPLVYALLEIGVGISSALTLILIPVSRYIYGQFTDGSTVTIFLLVIKFILSSLIIVIPTLLMGGTLPVLVRYIHHRYRSASISVSRLYAVNTLGAAIGVLLSAFVLIELLGLRITLLTGVAINLIVGFLALFLSKAPKQSLLSPKSVKHNQTSWYLLNGAYALSGLVAIAYEILWTRILTPTVGTFIYAFALILATYLIGIALGSLIYSKVKSLFKLPSTLFCLSELGIGFFALSSVYLTSNQITLGRELIVLAVILPTTISMGIAYPAIVALLEKDHQPGRAVSFSYFSNTVGSILGGFLASFIIIPLFGSSQGILVLVVVNFLIAGLFTSKKFIKASGAFLILFSLWLFFFKHASLYPNLTQWRLNWAKQKQLQYTFVEDNTASVFAYYDEKHEDQNLFIDGVPTTGKVGETKLMAHIPLLLHPNPQNILIIAFGMGTTYRSSLNHNLKVDVVELVPSVPSLMTFFYRNANQLLSHPQGKIIINDGRNYVFLTPQKYDVVTIDPPPPFNSAGTTVLYAQEFYQNITQKLQPNGIVSQWIWFGSRQDDIYMTIKSFINIFPYVLAFAPPDGGGGVFLEGSFQPLDSSLMPKRALEVPSSVTFDLQEKYPAMVLSDLSTFLIADQDDLRQLLVNVPPVTDDHPRTEYFLLRHLFQKAPTTINKHAQEVLSQ